MIIESPNKHILFGAGNIVDGMTDLSWIEIFKTIPKNEIVSPTMVNNETGDIIGKDTTKSFRLIREGIYFGLNGEGGAGIIFWNGKEYQWFHVE